MHSSVFRPSVTKFESQEPVKGSTSRKYPELNKVKDSSLSTHDVDGAQPKARSVWRESGQHGGSLRINDYKKLE